MSEIASPDAVVEILITQNSAVTSGTFAARGCWLNTLSSERTTLSSFYVGSGTGIRGGASARSERDRCSPGRRRSVRRVDQSVRHQRLAQTRLGRPSLDDRVGER